MHLQPSGARSAPLPWALRHWHRLARSHRRLHHGRSRYFRQRADRPSSAERAVTDKHRLRHGGGV